HSRSKRPTAPQRRPLLWRVFCVRTWLTPVYVLSMLACRWHREGNRRRLPRPVPVIPGFRRTRPGPEAANPIALQSSRAPAFAAADIHAANEGVLAEVLLDVEPTRASGRFRAKWNPSMETLPVAV